jgi:hypothetical protein
VRLPLADMSFDRGGACDGASRVGTVTEGQFDEFDQCLPVEHQEHARLALGAAE